MWQDAIRNERIAKARAAREAAARAAAADGYTWDGNKLMHNSLVHMPSGGPVTVSVAPSHASSGEWELRSGQHSPQVAGYGAAAAGFGTASPAGDAGSGFVSEEDAEVEGMEKRSRRRRRTRRGARGGGGGPRAASGESAAMNAHDGPSWDDGQSLRSGSENHSEAATVSRSNSGARLRASAAVAGRISHVGSAEDVDDDADELSELLGGLGVHGSDRPSQAPSPVQHAATFGPGLPSQPEKNGTGARADSIGAKEGGRRYLPPPPKPARPQHAPQPLSGTEPVARSATTAAAAAASAAAAAALQPRQDSYVFSVGFSPASSAPAPARALAYRSPSALRDTSVTSSTATERLPRQAQQAPEVGLGAQQRAGPWPQAEQRPAGRTVNGPRLVERTLAGSSGSRTRRAAISQTDALLLCPITQVRLLTAFLQRCHPS